MEIPYASFAPGVPGDKLGIVIDLSRIMSLH